MKTKQKYRLKSGIFVVPAFSLCISRIGLTPHKHAISIVWIARVSQGDVDNFLGVNTSSKHSIDCPNSNFMLEKGCYRHHTMKVNSIK